MTLRPTAWRAAQFPNFAPDLPKAEQRPDLAAGLGVIVFEGPQGRGFYEGATTGRRPTASSAWSAVAAAYCCLPTTFAPRHVSLIWCASCSAKPAFLTSGSMRIGRASRKCCRDRPMVFLAVGDAHRKAEEK